MNYKAFIIFSLIVVFSLTSFKVNEEVTVNWLTFEEAVEQLKSDKKKVFIDVYTDWCGWCKVMDKNTFSQPIIAKYLNDNYLPVKFNAEQTEDITFNGVTYEFVPSGRKGYHQLAAALLQNKLSYPQFVILNEKMEIINITAGYQKPEPFHKIISFYKEESYISKEEAEKFEKEYQSPFSE